jgi:two-component system sensor histidine kinase BaeS
LARRLVRPIRALASATHRLAAGQFDIRVPVGSSDELGHLARDFNSLAVTLEKNEQARRQWVADISHELRTPLAVLRGEIEALQDGIRQPTPDSVRSLHGEVLRLSRLVDDLYQLSLSDLGALTYRKENLDVAELLTEALTSYRPELAQKEIRLTLELPRRGTAKVFGDPERLHQLFANVLDNALKYTDAGGALAIRLDVGDGQARLDFQDSAPGVPESKLERLFDRLYRVETSRNRAAGGAGLGLAICRNIVEAHAGRITAQPSPLGGVWIRITLPLTETS